MKSKEVKQAEAAECQEARDKRSPQQQIAVLDARFGVGQGAKKERERLYDLIIKEAAIEPNTPLEKIAPSALRDFIAERRAERGE